MLPQNSLIRLGLLALMALALGACASMGNRLDTQSVNSIQKGVTTKTQVESSLGSPMSVSILPDGRRSALYMHHESHGDALMYVPYVNYVAGGVESRTQNLQIIYSKDGVVEDYEFTDSSKHTTGGLLNQHGTEVPTASVNNQ